MASPGRNAIRCQADASPWRTPTARENGELEQYVGPRVMEGLIMAGIGLTAHASTRLHPEG
jgi:hypothetical protein